MIQKLYEVADKIDGKVIATFVFKEDAEDYIRTVEPRFYVREFEFDTSKRIRKRKQNDQRRV